MQTQVYQMPRAPLSPWWFRGLIILGVVAFLVAVLSNAVQAAVLNADYYQKALDDEDAYNRAYDELSQEDFLSPITSDLLGGVQIPILSQAPELLRRAYPVELLERQMERAIEDLIAYLKKHKELTLTLDITPYVNGIPEDGIGTIGDSITDTPTEESDDFGNFRDDLDDIIEGIGGEGRLPVSIPVFQTTDPGEQQEIVDLVLSATDTPANSAEGEQIEASVKEGLASGTASGLDDAVAPLLQSLALAAVGDLTDAEFVREEVDENGETRYVVGPPQEIVDKVDNALFWVQLISAESYWLRPVGIAVCVACLAMLAFLSRRDGAALSRRIGLVLLIGGLIGFLVWLISLPILQSVVIDAAFEGGKAPSEAFDDLARDVINRCVSNLTPFIWIPSLIAAGMGAALVILARWVLPAKRVHIPAA